MTAPLYIASLGFRINTLFHYTVLALLLTLIPVSYVVAQTCVTPPGGMISWWPGDGDASDIQGTNDGTPQNGVTVAVGKVGPALGFDGVDDYVSIPDSPDFDLQSFTLDAWIKTDHVGFMRIVSQQDAAGNFWLMGVTGGGQLRFGTSLEPTIAGKGPVINDGQWHHVAVVRDTVNNMGQWYVDGMLVGTVAVTSDASISVAHDAMIGRFEAGPGGSHGHYFAGEIDEVEVFNRALSAGEIQAIFNAGSDGKLQGGGRF